MKIVLPGGTGHLAGLLASFFRERGHHVVVLGRSGVAGTVRWDGRTTGSWADELDGADAVVNLAGRSVNCRYTAANLRAMMDSRVDSTRVVGEAIARAKQPPRVWLQSSTATIYAHRFDGRTPRRRASSAARSRTCRPTGPAASRSRKPGRRRSSRPRRRARAA